MGRWGWWWGGGDKNTEGTNERTTGMGIACPPNIPLSPLYHILKLHENQQNNRWYWSCRIQKIVLHTKQKNFKDRPEETKTTARAAILRFGDISVRAELLLRNSFSCPLLLYVPRYNYCIKQVHSWVEDIHIYTFGLTPCVHYHCRCMLAMTSSAVWLEGLLTSGDAEEWSGPILQ